MSDVISVVKVLTTFVDKKIVADKENTVNKTFLYKTGSTLTPTNLGQMSY